MNNNFVLGENLPIPNTFSNASKTLRMLSNIKLDSKENELLKALQEINFERNGILIESLVKLPHLEDTKQLILKLLSVLGRATCACDRHSRRSEVIARLLTKE